MLEIYSQIVGHLRGMWRFRWRALIVAWLVALSAWAYIFTMPNEFESKTQVYVDTESTLRPLLKGLTTEPNIVSQVEMMTRLLLSRAHLEDVARKTDLDLRSTSQEQYEGLIEKLKRTIQIQTGRGNNLFTISFVDHDPVMAHSVVEALLSRFVGDSIVENRSDSAQVIQFLEQQIKEHEERLTGSEQRLAEFKKENVGVMPGAEGDYYARLQAALSQQEKLKADLTLAYNNRSELRKQLEGEEPTFGISDYDTQANFVSSVDARISELEERLNQLELNYTDKHPDVVAVKATLDDLYSKREAELAQSSNGPQASLNPLDINPVYQSLRLQMSQTELEISQLQTRASQNRKQIEVLRQSTDTIPEVEAQLSRLNRDYDVTKQRYEELLNRLESARLGEDANQTNDDVKFRIIDPPTVPLQASGPNRPLFFAAALVAGLVSGLAIAFFFHQLRPVFINRRNIQSALGVPVLGLVTAITTPKQKLIHRIQLGLFGATAAALLMVFLFAMIFQDNILQIINPMTVVGAMR